MQTPSLPPEFPPTNSTSPSSSSFVVPVASGPSVGLVIIYSVMAAMGSFILLWVGCAMIATRCGRRPSARQMAILEAVEAEHLEAEMQSHQQEGLDEEILQSLPLRPYCSERRLEDLQNLYWKRHIAAELDHLENAGGNCRWHSRATTAGTNVEFYLAGNEERVVSDADSEVTAGWHDVGLDVDVTEGGTVEGIASPQQEAFVVLQQTGAPTDPQPAPASPCAPTLHRSITSRPSPAQRTSSRPNLSPRSTSYFGRLRMSLTPPTLSEAWDTTALGTSVTPFGVDPVLRRPRVQMTPDTLSFRGGEYFPHRARSWRRVGTETRQAQQVVGNGSVGGESVDLVEGYAASVDLMDECVICLERFGEGEHLRVLP
ncbi:hypothetical protein M427DRAFT_32416 [Gonapodya prolifera JEL478]|uniref:Uncharacterized protein n=1 Tax=Gonapodya prolifera (strain JEL478) TaxID=1344416 RepID=A0A139AF77_GONPJ|nr:hypothetical protein M427DRAFT_32416 [Gonapodya prolifera JEL478]|eukprot:KXS15471.1 hypothetical protein M427DRAFT_32416 [Gonapodya prolifera JEL478]